LDSKRYSIIILTNKITQNSIIILTFYIDIIQQYKQPKDNILNSFYDKYKSFHNFGLYSKNKDLSSFVLTDKNTTLLSMNSKSIIYQENFKKFDFYLKTKYIYGFGERNRKFLLEEGIYTSWPNDTVIYFIYDNIILLI